MSMFERLLNLTSDEMEWYTKVNRAYDLKPTGEVIRESWEDGSIHRIVFTGRWTPHGAMRDCGDHYIIARGSRYDSISKDLKTITYDVNDN